MLVRPTKNSHVRPVGELGGIFLPYARGRARPGGGRGYPPPPVWGSNAQDKVHLGFYCFVCESFIASDRVAPSVGGSQVVWRVVRL